jgi:O-antigen/teichoic acid export membrane protein
MSVALDEKPKLANPQPRRPSVLRNISSNWASYLLGLGVNFFLSPYVVRHLGNTAYGVWSLTISLTGYLGLLDLGVRGAVTRYVAKFHTEADHDSASNVASSAMLIFSTAGLIAIVSSILLAAFVLGHLRIPPEFLLAARIVLVVTGLSIATSLVNGVFGGILVGLQRFDLTNSIEMGISLLRAGAIVWALHLGYGIVTLACLQLAFTIARWGASIGLVRSHYPQLRIRLSLVNRPGIKLIFSFSVFSFLLHVSGSLIYASDSLVIGVYLPVTAVTFYVIGGNLIEYTRTLVGGISQIMTPLASSTEARKDPLKLQKIVLFGSRAGTMVALPIALTFMLRGSEFIGLWMGPQYAALSGKIVWVLSLTLLFWAANSVTAGSMLGLSKHKPLVPVLLAEGLFNLMLSIFWVKRMGIVGVAWGTVVPSLVTSLAFWPWYVRRTLGIHPFDYIVSAWLRPLFAILPFALGSYLIEHFSPATHLIVFFLQVALVLPLAAAGYWLICLDQTQRKEYSTRFHNSFGRVFARS